MQTQDFLKFATVICREKRNGNAEKFNDIYDDAVEPIPYGEK